MCGYFIVVDIGATYTRVGIASFDKIIDKRVFKTPRDGYVAEYISRIISRYYSSYLGEVDVISIASIGPLDLGSGRIINPPNLSVKEIDLVKPLQEYFGKPVYVVNDAVAGVYGEKKYGLGKNYENIVYVTISTGVGGGVIVDNHLLLGKKGNAHEIGHIVVKYDSDIKCGCGGYGHWEAYAGGANIPRLARILAEKYNEINTPCKYEALTGKLCPEKLFKYYREKDVFAEKIVDEIIKACIAGFATIINLYDPEIITIGGSVFLNNKDILLKPVLEGLKKHIVTSPPIIKPTPLGEDIVLYGALAIAVDPPQHLLKYQKTI